jgi:hypothetical protein
MTDLNNDHNDRELNLNELDAVAGGDFLHVLDDVLCVVTGPLLRVIANESNKLLH